MLKVDDERTYSSAAVTDRRLVVTGFFTVLLAVLFWFGSRYPQLEVKALMGGHAPISGLAFDTILEVLPGDSLWREVAANTVNWIYTNWRGMTFGVLFGACMLTGLSLLRHRSFNRPVADAALGMAIGTPLGVCVNCAAPIAKGLHDAGARLETTLAALVASPTLNVIVITMTFALLPFYMAAIKLAAMLAFILVGIPLITRLLLKRERELSGGLSPAFERLQSKPSVFNRFLAHVSADGQIGTAAPNLGSALLWFFKAFPRNLLFLALATVPLMLLAGALGALLATILPLDYFARAMNQLVPSNYFGVALGMLGLAAFAIILPVPIAFDVIAVAVLTTNALPVHYGLVLLIGLSSFSLLSFLVVGQSISYRVAMVMTVALIGLAVTAGVAGRVGKHFHQEREGRVMLAILRDAPKLDLPKLERPQGHSFDALKAKLATHKVSSGRATQTVNHEGLGVVTAQSLQKVGANNATGSTHFTRIAASSIGIDEQNPLLPPRIFAPYGYFTAIAAGDVHGDGWDDIVMASSFARGGLSLYSNISGRFLRQEIDLGPIDRVFVTGLALVDIDNDGWLDLYVSTHTKGVHVFFNRQGEFDAGQRVELPNGDAVMVGAAAFADLDGDGDLDIVHANWTGGELSGLIPHRVSSRDRILWNEGDRFTVQELAGVPGESLTSLILDINRDGRLDIVIGDDAFDTDKIFINEGHRKFRLMGRGEGVVPWLTATSMSIDSGDFNNDLIADIYMAQIAFEESVGRSYFSDANAIMPCDQMVADGFISAHERSACHRSLRDQEESYRFSSKDPANSRCHALSGTDARLMCVVRSAMQRAAWRGSQQPCELISEKLPRLRDLCVIASARTVPDGEKQLKQLDAFRSLMDRNILLKGSTSGSFADVGRDMGAGYPNWSWNAKLADLDQDGWQDIFVVNGLGYLRHHHSNTLFHNRRGENFTDGTAAFGLTDYTPSFAYVLIDHDRDGDLDIIRAPSVGGSIIHRNDRPSGGALWVRLRDEIGNSHAIGARIEIETVDGKRQFRDIKASGGFVSFDPAYAHFGLGSSKQVRNVQVTWPDGSRSTLAGPFAANEEIFVIRSKN